jgi:hypothetical protein
MSTELVVQPFDLSKPEQSIKVAEILQKFVKEKKLTSNIKGKDYPQVEAWQFAGSQLGLYPIVTEVQNISTDKEIKYAAWVDIRRINDDRVMSRGFAICSNLETTKRAFDEYAICSMAQTRAEGKAFRMLLSWLMKAAGFEATPAEEMDFADEKKNVVTSYNHNPIEKNGMPLISNAQFKKANERIRAGELDVYYKIIATFSLESNQANILKNTYENAKASKVERT